MEKALVPGVAIALAPIAVLSLALVARADSSGAGKPPAPSASTAPTASAPRAIPKPPPRTPLWEQQGKAAEAPARRLVVDRVVAIVGRRIVLLSEVRRTGASAKRAYAQLALAERLEAERRIDRDELDRHVARLLEEDAAQKKSIVIKESDIDAAFAEVAKSNSFDHDGLLKAVADAGMTEEEYRRELRAQLLHYKVLTTIITPRTTSSPGITSEEWMKRLEAEHAVWILEQKRDTFVEVRL